MSSREDSVYRMALEGLEGPVAAEATNVDAHVCAAGGEGGVVLPVDIQCWGCGIYICMNIRSHLRGGRTQPSWDVAAVGFHCSGCKVSWLYLSEKGTAAWLLLCVHPILLSSEKIRFDIFKIEVGECRVIIRH